MLAAAEETFATQGPAAPIDVVASLARVSKGTVYHHFEDKTALLEAVYRRQLTWLAASASAAAARHSDPWRQLWAVATSYVEGYVGESRSPVLLRSAPYALGLECSQRIETEMLAPPIGMALERLALARQLIAAKPTILVDLVLGLIREAALTASRSTQADSQAAVLKIVQPMLRGLLKQRDRK